MKGEFWFFPHGYLNGWAAHLIDDAQSVSTGSANYYRISALLAVMSFEAYLNYIGERHFKDWSKRERKPWATKLKLVLNKFKLASRKEAFFSLLDDRFKYRNTLAHGRIAVIGLDYLDHEDGRVEGDHTGDPDWYRDFGTREQAEKTLRAVRDVMVAIHEAADPNDNRLPWTIQGTGESTEVPG